MKRLLIAVVLGACATDEAAVPSLSFPVDGTVEEAWGRAGQTPAAGIPAISVAALGIADGTEVQLLAGRSSNDPGYPYTTGDDVIIADPHLLVTRPVEAGQVTFPPLAVVDGAWSSESGAVPAALLCGVTVVAARAYDREGSAQQMLAATWVVVSAPTCD